MSKHAYLPFVSVLLITLASLISCNAQDAQVYTASGNYATDLVGVQDTRTNTWGKTASVVYPLTFAAPAGTKTKILSVRGDLVAWIKSLPGDARTPEESASGVLASFSTTSPSGSAQCSNCADNCGMYVQGVVTEKQPSMRLSFNISDFNMVLDPDGVIEVKLATWLNTTGKPIHIEITYTVRFIYDED